LIKVIGNIVESVALPKVTESIAKVVREEGVEGLLRKVVESKGRMGVVQRDREDEEE
jgi:hypothetical protein